ncbi:glycoside hydrolase family 99-like domain-containing protein [uncultured Cycloclasticus sp.]|uniref:glycosyltransferase WbsX family protein n=1 Tax=uncultured Cycloclasticus sp. TaxID=172194 RepID=UPI00258AAD22|nr:glycoside hydrolase family 99-like domain-containing protein [uncultured Cycloclasticus sp.]
MTIESMKANPKLIAIYFPQFHTIKENDHWWGSGFTDWKSVKAGKSQFEGHDQPRKAFRSNYYDQTDLKTLRWQIDLAKKYGVYGFCHYHYWFDGKQLLEAPTNLMLEHKELEMPFCLSWANETWSRRWDGNDHQVLIKQTHPPIKERWKLHFDYLITAWTDPRAIKVDGKPVFVIYRPHQIPKISHMLEYWRELASKAGLKGLYFIAQKQYEFPNRECLKCFDGVFQFEPFEAIYSPTFDKTTIKHSSWFKLVRALPEPIQDSLRAVRAKYINEQTFYDYDKVWSHIIEVREDAQLTTYPGAFVDWDNSARYKNRATIFKGGNPERFEYWFSKLLTSMGERSLPEPLIFINAWNEWAEGAYLEPDERYGHAYLEAVKKALGSS